MIAINRVPIISLEMELASVCAVYDVENILGISEGASASSIPINSNATIAARIGRNEGRELVPHLLSFAISLIHTLVLVIILLSRRCPSIIVSFLVTSH